ncbi:YtxH domain-containing protein [Bacillus sp. Marseille-P3661]|uniref:YtxH domain-containing protein n=1 Tax=Bacillus sp. Marseille-P3661 TaxID=1936234 RepID=UPI000C85DB20|nr:YtxH domain-containing protein [Bacillus sp. Marseille-P3661]
MSKGKSLLAGILVGGVAATITTLLVSPKSGHEWRETIKLNSSKVKDAVNALKLESSSIKEQVVNSSKESALILKDFSNDVKTSVSAWRKDIEPNQARINDELKNIEESFRKLESLTNKE